ncbi:MAG TPA: TonB-dependent receptor [Steroidobacteraceae bacterium]|nr:TonB-dependent receptor [Steroidobacteraceae bacterium]
MYGSSRLIRSAVTSALALAATPVLADQAAAPESQSGVSALQEIVVTAQKRVEKLHDVPMGITAVSNDQMDKLRLSDFQDLQAMVPALSVEQIQPGLSRLTLRGENVGGVGSTVTTYIDDIPVGSSNALANGSIITGDFDTWDLQRVEVLRGPQGTLYGAGSEGGLLKYVTMAPDPTHAASAFQVGLEDLAHGDWAAITKGMVNIPIGSSAALRISGFFSGIPGYIDDAQLGEGNVNRGSREGWRASLLFKPTENLSIRLTSFGQDLHTDGTNSVDVIGSAGTPLTPPANQLQPDGGDYNQNRFINEPSSFRYRVYSATLDWNLGWGGLTSVSSYSKNYQNLFTDVTSATLQPGVTFGDLANLVATGAFPPPETVGLAETNVITMEKKTQELRLASTGTRTLDWQLGAFFTHEASIIEQSLPSFSIPSDALTPLPSFESPHLGAVYKEFSGFGQVTWHFNPQFDVGLGARWSQNKQTEDESIGGLLVNPVQLTGGTSTGTDWTYSIAPRWHVSDNTLVYARVATGYRPGGPNALPPILPAGVATEYQADTTTNYELGTRTAFADNRVSIDVAAFLIDWKKIQLFEFVDSFGINANGGTARSKGLEWTLGLTPVQGLNFLITGAYIDANLTSDAPAAGGSNGDELPYAPRFSGSLDASYSWHMGADVTGFVGSTWSYTGERISDFAATATVSGGALVFVPDPRASLPSYHTVNLRAGFDSARWSFELYLKNAGDIRGITSYGNSGTPNFGGAIGLIQPRTLGALVTLHL